MGGAHQTKDPLLRSGLRRQGVDDSVLPRVAAGRGGKQWTETGAVEDAAQHAAVASVMRIGQSVDDPELPYLSHLTP
jgi:hypothetical protein